MGGGSYDAGHKHASFSDGLMNENATAQWYGVQESHTNESRKSNEPCILKLPKTEKAPMQAGSSATGIVTSVADKQNYHDCEGWLSNDWQQDNAARDVLQECRRDGQIKSDFDWTNIRVLRTYVSTVAVQNGSVQC